MKFSEFLKEVDGEEEDIIEYEGKEALEKVKQNGFILQFVKKQTPEICLEAVKQNGRALQFVRNQTPAICIEAIREDKCAIKYVDKSIFDPE